ncbi:hypothetical protein GCM10011579_016630 [Streptomyces albiflavescens]|uniref:Uncharacterized protein n=1 Tax=Streptomyces albiflavescens TaxID=1623582 RepID=A0A918D0X5_9ACTN|nr:hypothetical protein GCM10011579_016630 [Streptomyces albiflavescens]
MSRIPDGCGPPSLCANLGCELDLVARIDELAGRVQQLATERDDLKRERDGLAARLEETEEDLAAARTSLREMIRRDNT